MSRDLFKLSFAWMDKGKQVDRVLKEIEDLRNGPSEVDIACFHEIETEKLRCSCRELIWNELLKTEQEILGSDNVQFRGTEIRRIMSDNCTPRNVCLALHSRASLEEGSEYDSDSEGDDEEGSEDDEEGSEGDDEDGSEDDEEESEDE